MHVVRYTSMKKSMLILHKHLMYSDILWNCLELSFGKAEGFLFLKYDISKVTFL